MRTNTVKQMLNRGSLVVNAWCSIPSSYSAEGLGHQGFDSVTVDLQHGMIAFSDALHMMQAISSTPAIPLVRSPGLDPEKIMHLLDAGAYGVICPMISNARDAAEFVSACRYPGEGMRSFGPSRGLLYGGTDYFQNANREILTSVMIETRMALSNLDEILSVNGLDMVYVGPNDLALELGELPGAENIEGTKTANAVSEILARSRAKEIPAGIFCSSSAHAAQRGREGYTFVTPGNDFGTLMRGAKQAAADSRAL